MAKRTYRVRFTMTFENEIEADSDEEAEKILGQTGTGDVWENNDWNLEDTECEIVDGWPNDDEADDEAVVDEDAIVSAESAESEG